MSLRATGRSQPCRARDHWPPELGDDQFLLLKPPSLWCFVMAAGANTQRMRSNSPLLWQWVYTFLCWKDLSATTILADYSTTKWWKQDDGERGWAEGHGSAQEQSTHFLQQINFKDIEGKLLKVWLCVYVFKESFLLRATFWRLTEETMWCFGSASRNWQEWLVDRIERK